MRYPTFVDPHVILATALMCTSILLDTLLSACLAEDLGLQCAQVEIVVDEMRRSLTRRAGVDRRLPQFVGMSGFQDYAINIVVLVSHACHHKTRLTV